MAESLWAAASPAARNRSAPTTCCDTASTSPWNSRWNRTGEYRRPRILYLADRNVLVDNPKDKTFAPFGEARHKIEGEAIKSREMYFATYQAIAKDEIAH